MAILIAAADTGSAPSLDDARSDRGEQGPAVLDAVRRPADEHAGLTGSDDVWAAEHRRGEQNLPSVAMDRRKLAHGRDAVGAGADVNSTLWQRCP